MRPNPTIFREYDIRGIADQDFDATFAFRLGRAYMKYAQETLGKQAPLKISVGRDCRLTGEKYSMALMAGLESAGAELTYLDLVSTPVTYFSIFHKDLDGAIMVTGSHNPPEYNGFKICVGKSTIHGEAIKKLGEYLNRDDAEYTNQKPDYEHYEIVSEYIDYVKNNVRVKPGLKIVVDSGNGAASLIAPDTYKKLGCEIIPLFCEPDGTFPNHEADPTVVENLQDTIKAVKEHGADAGIAFDGDADRIGVINEKGEILWGDELMVLFSRNILRDNAGATIISEVKSSKRLYDDIASHGGNPIMWKTGHSLIKSKMKETNAALAGEMSGHMFFADRYFGFDDAIYAGARLLEILSENEKPLSALLSDLPGSFSTPEIRVECADDKKFQVVEQLKKNISGKFETIDIDGVRVNFADGWGLVRASNTQPVIVMRFEANSDQRLQEIRSIIEAEAKEAGLNL